jgi:hypothetical protein
MESEKIKKLLLKYFYFKIIYFKINNKLKSNTSYDKFFFIKKWVRWCLCVFEF